MTQLFQCLICEKRFTFRKPLEIHFLTHSGLKPHQCTTCAKPFAQRCHLNRHMRLVHKAERRYACEVCGRVFGERSSLLNHRRLHTGERVACTLCDKDYSHPSSLAVHVNKVHRVGGVLEAV